MDNDWNGLTDLIANLITKYAGVLDLDNLPNPTLVNNIEDKNRYIVEMHFEDWNYYEIELTDEDVVDEIVENLLNNLVLERFMNKQNPEINWKNVRYFEKEERERSKN